jgi:hypothetical protein
VTISSAYFGSRCSLKIYDFSLKFLSVSWQLWLLFYLMFHLMWNETWINGHVNENERKSLFKLNNNWNVFKWVTTFNGSFIVFVSSHVDHRAQHVSHNASIFDEHSSTFGWRSHTNPITLINSFFFYSKCCFFFNFLKLDLKFP